MDSPLGGIIELPQQAVLDDIDGLYSDDDDAAVQPVLDPIEGIF